MTFKCDHRAEQRGMRNPAVDPFGALGDLFWNATGGGVNLPLNLFGGKPEAPAATPEVCPDHLHYDPKAHKRISDRYNELAAAHPAGPASMTVVDYTEYNLLPHFLISGTVLCKEVARKLPFVADDAAFEAAWERISAILNAKPETGSES